ncbi:MAG: ABC transporter permease, partial [Gemmataceae bacterium]
TGNGLNTSVRMGLATVINSMTLFSVLTFLTTALLVGALYSGLLAERKQEMGLFLAMGMRPMQLIRLILAEAGLTTSIGGILGVLLGCASLVWFRRSLGYSLALHQVPFTLPGLSQMVAAGLTGVFLSCLVGFLGALVPAYRASNGEPYDLIRSEGM